MNDTVARFLDVPRLCRCRWRLQRRGRNPRPWVRVSTHLRCPWPPHQHEAASPRSEHDLRRAA